MNVQIDLPSISGKRILITGGAGFIGHNIAEALVRKNDVRILDDLSGGSRSNVPDEATLIEGDVRNGDVLDRATDSVDIIFHNAALVSVEESLRRPELTHEVNVTATVNLLERARRESARFVFASSAAVYGHPETVPIPESASTEPTSPYGLSKLVAEKYVRLYADLYDLSAISLRYFNVYGPGQIEGDYSAVIGVFLKQAMAGDSITVEGNGSQTRDFVHVMDIARANLLAAGSEVTGVINVGTGESVSILELAEIIREIVVSDSDIVHTSRRPGDIDRSCADVSRLESTLGLKRFRALEEGLSEVVERFRSEPVERDEDEVTDQFW